MGFGSARYACLIKVHLTSLVVKLEAVFAPCLWNQSFPGFFLCAQASATRAVTNMLLLILPGSLPSSS